MSDALGFTWNLPRGFPPDERSRMIYLCPLCTAWQLDAGSHETTSVLEELVAEHALDEHGFRSAAGFYAAVVAKREADAEAEWLERTAAPRALDDALAAWAEERFRLDSLEVAVLELHRLDREDRYGSPSCRSCGFDGSEDPIAWPCDTAEVFIEAARLDGRIDQ